MHIALVAMWARIAESVNVAADMAVWCHVRVATAGVSSVVLTMTGVYPALPSEFGGSCSSLVAACMSAAFTYVTLVPSEMWCGT